MGRVGPPMKGLSSFSLLSFVYFTTLLRSMIPPGSQKLEKILKDVIESLAQSIVLLNSLWLETDGSSTVSRTSSAAICSQLIA